MSYINMLNLVYPVGFSVIGDKDPVLLFGGTWESASFKIPKAEKTSVSLGGATEGKQQGGGLKEPIVCDVLKYGNIVNIKLDSENKLTMNQTILAKADLEYKPEWRGLNPNDSRWNVSCAQNGSINTNTNNLIIDVGSCKDNNGTEYYNSLPRAIQYNLWAGSMRFTIYGGYQNQTWNKVDRAWKAFVTSTGMFWIGFDGIIATPVGENDKWFSNGFTLDLNYICKDEDGAFYNNIWKRTG